MRGKIKKRRVWDKMFWGKSLRELEKQSGRRDIQICEGLYC